MKKIGVTISGADSNNVFWEALAETLKGEPDLRICKVRLGRRLECILRRWQPQVLIIEVSQGQSQVAYKHYFDLSPRLAIIGLDTGSTEAIVCMRDLGRDMLLELIHTLTNELPNLTDHTDYHRLHLGNVNK